MQDPVLLPGPFVSLCRLRSVAACEHADSLKKQEMAWHWGNTGRMQAEALTHCLALLASASTEHGFLSLPHAAAALRTYKQGLTQGSYDADGFMSATVSEFLKVLSRLEDNHLAHLTSRLLPVKLLNRWRVNRLLRQAPWSALRNFDI